MKTIRFSPLAVMLLFSITGNSTHLMGVEIVAQRIGGYQYRQVLTVYRNTSGIPMQTIAQFNITDSAGFYALPSLKAA